MTPANRATATYNMANQLSSHRPLTEGRKPALIYILSEDSNLCMGSPPRSKRQHASGVPAPLSSDSEQSDAAVRAQLSLGSDGESGKYSLCSTQPDMISTSMPHFPRAATQSRHAGAAIPILDVGLWDAGATRVIPKVRLWDGGAARVAPKVRLWDGGAARVAPKVRLWDAGATHPVPTVGLWDAGATHTVPKVRLWDGRATHIVPRANVWCRHAGNAFPFPVFGANARIWNAGDTLSIASANPSQRSQDPRAPVAGASRRCWDADASSTRASRL